MFYRYARYIKRFEFASPIDINKLKSIVIWESGWDDHIGLGGLELRRKAIEGIKVDHFKWYWMFQ